MVWFDSHSKVVGSNPPRVTLAGCHSGFYRIDSHLRTERRTRPLGHSEGRRVQASRCQREALSCAQGLVGRTDSLIPAEETVHKHTQKVSSSHAIFLCSETNPDPAADSEGRERKAPGVENVSRREKPGVSGTCVQCYHSAETWCRSLSPWMSVGMGVYVSLTTSGGITGNQYSSQFLPGDGLTWLKLTFALPEFWALHAS